MRTREILIAAAVLGIALVALMMWTRDQAESPSTVSVQEETMAPGSDGPVARISEQELAEGFVPLIAAQEDGGFDERGWNHYGPGYFTLDLGDFTLRLEFMTAAPKSNSGIFLRVPGVPVSDDYIYHSFEVQIDASAPEAIHRTGGVYDAEAPSEDRARPPGEWNEMEISFVGDRITVDLNGAQVVDWVAEPRGKIEDFAARGYLGLQNHDVESSVYFRNIRVKKVD